MARRAVCRVTLGDNLLGLAQETEGEERIYSMGGGRAGLHLGGRWNWGRDLVVVETPSPEAKEGD